MNTASRLQSGAAPGEVLVGEPTWRLVRDAVAAEPAPPLAAKGKAEPVPAWRVLALAPGSPARARRLDAPMVGRDREAALLAGAYRQVADGRACRLFTVLGVAGAGKSRLVEEFLGSLGDMAEVLRGRCLSYGEGITWLPLAEALRPALGLAEFAGQTTSRQPSARPLRGRGPTPRRSPMASAACSACRARAARSRPPGRCAASWRRGLANVRSSSSSTTSTGPSPPCSTSSSTSPSAPTARSSCSAWRARSCSTRGPAGAQGPARPTSVHLEPLAPADADALVGALLGGAALPAERARAGDLGRRRQPAVPRGGAADAGRRGPARPRRRRLGRGGRSVGPPHPADGVRAALLATRPPPGGRALGSSRRRRSRGSRSPVGALEALLPEASRDALPGLLRSLARKDLVVPGAPLGPRPRRLPLPPPPHPRCRLRRDPQVVPSPAPPRLRRLARGRRGRRDRRAPRGPGAPPRPGATATGRSSASRTIQGLRMRAARGPWARPGRAPTTSSARRGSAVRLYEAAVELAPGTEEAVWWY